MPQPIATQGVGGVQSVTYFPPEPVEIGRARGVQALTVLTNGTSGVTTRADLATTCDRPGPQGLIVDITGAGGVATAGAVDTAGTRYRKGDVITAVGAQGSQAVTFTVTDVTG